MTRLIAPMLCAILLGCDGATTQTPTDASADTSTNLDTNTQNDSTIDSTVVDTSVVDTSLLDTNATSDSSTADSATDSASDSTVATTGANRITINGTEYILDGTVTAVATPSGVLTNFGYTGRRSDDSVILNFSLSFRTNAIAPGTLMCNSSTPPGAGAGNINFGGNTYRFHSEQSTCAFVVTQVSSAAGSRLTGTYSGTLFTTEGASIVVTNGAFDVTL